MNLILFGLTKTETGAKTAPWAPKLSYFDGRALQLCARFTLVPSGASVVYHLLFVKYIYNTF